VRHRHGRLSVDVTVTALGVTYVHWSVVLNLAGRGVLDKVTPRNGAGTLKLIGLPRGRVTYGFRYLGSHPTTPTVTLSKSVWIA
jgi:hypothetical protein